MKIFGHTCGADNHKFEARHEEVSTGYSLEHWRGYDLEGIRRLMVREVYVKDVCRYCGKEIQR